nr:ATP-binding protein [Oscillibacter sp. 1-3]
MARRYEKTSAVFTSNKTFSQWNEVVADVTIASAILDRVLHLALEYCQCLPVESSPGIPGSAPHRLPVGPV